MRLPLLALGWSAGIWLAAAGAPPFALYWGAPAALVAWWGLRGTRYGAWWALALLALTLGALRYHAVPASGSIAAYNERGGLTLEGIVIEPPRPRDSHLTLTVAVETVTQAGATTAADGRVLVNALVSGYVRYGDRVRATGTLETPGAGDLFSYADYLARSGIHSQLSDAAIVVVAHDQGSPVRALLVAVRDRASASINAALPEPHAGLLRGILLGDESGLSPEVEAAFTATGAAHVIAISGFNMIIISRTVSGGLVRLGVRQRRAMWIGLGVVALYTLLVGAGAAVVRAALMSALLIVGESLRRPTYVPASLAFAVLVLSLFDPLVLWDVGFQFSLAATFGIAQFAPALDAALNRLVRRVLPERAAAVLAAALSEPLVVSLAANLMLTPLIALYFGRLSPLVVAVNLLIVPAQAFLLISGGLATLTAFAFPPIAQGLYFMTLIPLAWTSGVVRVFAALPDLASIAVVADREFVAGLMMLVVAAAFVQQAQPRWWRWLVGYARGRVGALARAVLALTVIVLCGFALAGRPDGSLHVWLLSVGHSNALLIETPGGGHILIDGGRNPTRLLTALGDRLPVTKRHLDLVILTQPDENEFAALTAVAERYTVGAALTNGGRHLGERYAALAAALALRPARAGEQVVFADGLRLEVLAPARAPQPGDPLNDSTLVVRLRYGGVSFLLTGDASPDALDRVAQTADLTSTVVQVPQHGGRRVLSAAWLARVQPSVAVLHADPANRLGDPDPDTLALLDAAGVPVVYAGDRTLHVWTDGVGVWSARE